MSADYVESSLPWHRWIRYLAAALDLQELEEFRTWIVAQQDPKKFEWASADHAGTVADNSRVIAKLLKFGVEELGGKLAKSDPWAYFQATGKKAKKIFKAKKFDSDTGHFLGFVYVDERGQEVDTDGFQVVESHHEQAREEAKKVYDKIWGSRN